MTKESRDRRIAYLRKVAARRKNLDFHRKDTDLASIYRRLHSGYALIPLFGFGLYRGVRSGWFSSSSSTLDWMFQLLGVGFLLFMIYDVFRIRWATKIFYQCQVENVADIPTEESPQAEQDAAARPA